MLIKIEGVLSAEDVAHCRQTLEASPWVDGRDSAGAQSA